MPRGVFCVKPYNARLMGNDSRRQLIEAAWVAPINRSPIADGGVVFEAGRILSVGKAHELREQFPDVDRIDFLNCTVLPGLINAHTHLELSQLKCAAPAGRFIDWLGRLVPNPSMPLDQQTDAIAAATRTGIEQSLRFGVTTVGDISRFCSITRQVLQNSALRSVSYGEVLAMGQRRGLLEERLAKAADPFFQNDLLSTGITPHAPYSIEAHGYRRCLEVAKCRGLPLTTHLAETRDEMPFLSEQSGPFRELWERIGGWDRLVNRFAGGPIRYAAELGLMDYPTSFAHVNYCDDDELGILARSKTSVVYCPRTHAYFGHPPHRWRDMLAAGINVAVGTDSCASSPDLNLVDDLRLMHQLALDVAPDVLWEMATVRAAKALGLSEQIGSIAAGKNADLVAFPTITNFPLREILEKPILPTARWIAGKRIHPKTSE